MSEHTEGPWWVENHKNGCLFITAMEAPEGDICDLYHGEGDNIDRKGPDGVAEANAAFIVRACNCYDELLLASKTATEYFIMLEASTGIEYGVLTVLRGAIATATE